MLHKFRRAGIASDYALSAARWSRAPGQARPTSESGRPSKHSLIAELTGLLRERRECHSSTAENSDCVALFANAFAARSDTSIAGQHPLRARPTLLWTPWKTKHRWSRWKVCRAVGSANWSPQQRMFKGFSMALQLVECLCLVVLAVHTRSSSNKPGESVRRERFKC